MCLKVSSKALYRVGVLELDAQHISIPLSNLKPVVISGSHYSEGVRNVLLLSLIF